MDDATPGSLQQRDGRPKVVADEPKLCPAPTPDTPHGASDSAKDYENDVHPRVNPLAPIPQGFGVKVFDPVTGKYVFFDDCFRYAGDLVDGDMRAGDLVEAKGPRHDFLYAQDWATRMKRDLNQAENELQAADARGVGLKWYYAESPAADAACERFKDAGLGRIVVGYMSPSFRR